MNFIDGLEVAGPLVNAVDDRAAYGHVVRIILPAGDIAKGIKVRVGSRTYTVAGIGRAEQWQDKVRPLWNPPRPKGLSQVADLLRQFVAAGHVGKAGDSESAIE